MKFARTIAAASVAGAALGLVPLAAASAATAGQPAAVPVAAKAAKPVVINTCGSGGPAFTRPRDFGLSCDGSDSLIRLRWARWALRGASGHGAEALNDCLPDCANGKFRFYPVHVNFWGTAPVAGHPGEVRYTHYTLRYTEKVPSGLTRRRTGTL